MESSTQKRLSLPIINVLTTHILYGTIKRVFYIVKKAALNLSANLEPELIEIDQCEIAEEKADHQRPAVVPKRPQTSTSRPATARPSTARASTNSRLGSSLRKSSNSSTAYESHICRVPSATLRNITAREVNLDEYQSGIGDFLLLDVAKAKEDRTPNSARSERPNEPFKLSHKCKLK